MDMMNLEANCVFISSSCMIRVIVTDGFMIIIIAFTNIRHGMKMNDDDVRSESTKSTCGLRSLTLGGTGMLLPMRHHLP